MFSTTKEWHNSGPQRVPHIVNYSFPSNTPPDVTSKTRVLFLCGINNERVQNDPLGHGWASPMWDGWFFSDLFYLLHVLDGLGASQKIMTCVSLRDIVDEYIEYLHGNPCEERKIVMNKEMFETRNFSSPNFSVSHPNQLRVDFLKQLKKECIEAREQQQNFLVVLLSHGDFESKGLFLGGINSEDPQYIMTREMFSEAVGEQNVQICVMSAACYSGGWTVRPDILNITALTAASEENESSSWEQPKSMGRACGTIFSSALTTTSDQLGATQEITYKEYVDTILRVCTYHTDRLDDQGFSFSAQNDNWGLDYMARTGAPLYHFRARWNLLKGVPPAYEHPITNRDASRRNSDGSYKLINTSGVLQPDDSAELFEKFNPSWTPDVLHGLSASLRSRFGSVRDVDPLAKFRKHVARAGNIYLDSNPGRPNVYSNMELLTRIKNVHRSIPMTSEQLETVLTQIEYRMSLMEHANRLAKYLGLDRPRCQTIDMDDWIRNASGKSRSAYNYAREEIVSKRILGRPTSQQGREFPKPAMYLAACLSDWNKSRIDQAISILVKMYERSLSDLRTMVDSSSVVEGKKRKWMESAWSKLVPSPKKMRED
ncbi:hypothetical protein BKA65DRAFT_543915 [Rhexocercosporidium sp. MPI-PUGE-AT-0058]|nr:hypothetical protein BKA65DRAFT_543915 [Rhexocercosporidium sp. MPI-PUGE-AT-0058]